MEVTPMTRTIKSEYIKMNQKRYLSANRIYNALILNELSQTLAIHRKSAICLLNRPLEPEKTTRPTTNKKIHLPSVVSSGASASTNLSWLFYSTISMKKSSGSFTIFLNLSTRRGLAGMMKNEEKKIQLILYS